MEFILAIVLLNSNCTTSPSLVESIYHTPLFSRVFWSAANYIELMWRVCFLLAIVMVEALEIAIPLHSDLLLPYSKPEHSSHLCSPSNTWDSNRVTSWEDHHPSEFP